MKYIIYHRYPSYETNEEINEKIASCVSSIIRTPTDSIEIIKEEANNSLQQLKLDSLITRLKKENNPIDNMLICYSLCSLVASNVRGMIEQLAELYKITRINILVCLPIDLARFVILLEDYQKEVSIEKGKLLAYRISKNGLTYGRPSIDVDVEKATKLRMEGLSYKEISNRLGQSLSLIYSKLPKEVKTMYSNPRYKKCGRPKQKELEEKKIEGDKIQ